jgi:hypothetical protein
MFRNYFIGAVLLLAACGCSSLPPMQRLHESGKPDKLQTRNNAASLLSDLLKDEQNVGKVFIVKNASPEVTDLVKLIGATAATHERELEELATNDPALNLSEMDLPPGEMAARDGTAKSKEHDLLLSSDSNFEFNLLFSQAQAENYGWHLAAVAAKNSSQPEEAHAFSTIGETMERLYLQVMERMREIPAQ